MIYKNGLVTVEVSKSNIVCVVKNIRFVLFESAVFNTSHDILSYVFVDNFSLFSRIFLNELEKFPVFFDDRYAIEYLTEFEEVRKEIVVKKELWRKK